MKKNYYFYKIPKNLHCLPKTTMSKVIQTHKGFNKRHPAMFCHCECHIANQIPCLLNHTVCDSVLNILLWSQRHKQTNKQSVMITHTKKKKKYDS